MFFDFAENFDIFQIFGLATPMTIIVRFSRYGTANSGKETHVFLPIKKLNVINSEKEIPKVAKSHMLQERIIVKQNQHLINRISIQSFFKSIIVSVLRKSEIMHSRFINFDKFVCDCF